MSNGIKERFVILDIKKSPMNNLHRLCILSRQSAKLWPASRTQAVNSVLNITSLWLKTSLTGSSCLSNRLPDKNMWLFGLMLNKVGHLHVTIS